MDLTNIIHYVVWKYSTKNNLLSPTEKKNLIPIKLNKILWFADREAIIATGKSITGLTYIKKQYGPAIENIDSTIKELVVQKQIQTEGHTDKKGYKHVYLSSDKEIDISTIPENFIQFLDKSIDDSLKHRTDEYSEKSHDIAWEAVGYYEEISSAAIYASRTEHATDEDINWLKQQLNNQVTLIDAPANN